MNNTLKIALTSIVSLFNISTVATAAEIALNSSQQQQLIAITAPVIKKMQDGSITQTDIASAKAKVASVVPQAASASSVSDATPLGALMPFARLTCPTNWLDANGQLFPFFVNGNINFKGLMLLLESGGILKVVQNGTNISLTLPDLRGEFIRGWNSGDPKHPDYGRQIGSFQDQLQANAVGIPAVTLTRETRYSTVAGRGTAVSDGKVEQSEFTPKPGTEVRPRNLAFLYCMKVIN